MASYKELQAQLEKLHAQAESARLKETTAIIASIREKMSEYGLTVTDLGFRQRKTRSKTPAKFQNPETGETWTGRGRAPGWIEGKDRQSFMIQ